MVSMLTDARHGLFRNLNNNKPRVFTVEEDVHILVCQTNIVILKTTS